MSHHTVGTEEVGAVKTPGHGAGLPGLAAGAVGAVQLRVMNPGDSVVREEPGHSCRSQLAVSLTAGTRDLLRVLLNKNTNLELMPCKKFLFCKEVEKLFSATCSTFFLIE